VSFINKTKRNKLKMFHHETKRNRKKHNETNETTKRHVWSGMISHLSAKRIRAFLSFSCIYTLGERLQKHKALGIIYIYFCSIDKQFSTLWVRLSEIMYYMVVLWVFNFQGFVSRSTQAKFF